MTVFPRILATSVLCLAALGLSSCLCSDLPIVVNAIGREEARTYGKYQSPHEVEIYRLGDNYYVKCDLKFIPQESGLFTWNDMYAPVSSLFAFNKCTPELIEATPAETYMVLMTQYGLKLLLQIDADAPPESVPRMIPVGQFDFTHAVRCKPNPDPDWADALWTGGLVNIIYSTERCSTLHYALRPLYWASWAVEIPFVVVCNTAIYAVAIPASVIGEVTQQQHESSPCSPISAPSATKMQETRNKMPAASVYLLEKFAFHTVTCINIDEDYIHHHEHLLQNPPDSQPV